MENFRIDLPADRMPRKWYNALADMGQMMKPPLNPATGQPIDPSALSAIFPQSLIEQEMTGERWIDIPEPVLDRYMLWRPTPL
ncbi:MAG TPA: TrpB-like pyridoxal-phosphate dependent enzyme, partial [Planctomycetota bacterium]|nr:TrpB-like pyridoxal-phosphate dependent enzyme [Planctomycetota bacterium]